MSLLKKYSIEIAVVATATSVLVIKYIISNFKKKNKCIIIESVDDWNTHEKEILTTFEKSDIVGIDCEWVTIDDKRNPVSLLQIADKNEFCVLIRLSRIPVWLIPLGLSEFLKDKSILKVGVGVSEDAGKLFHDYCLEVNGCIDLRYLAKDLPELEGKPLGLKSLAKELLGYDLTKSKTLRCSDWDSDNLTSDQIKYAADDAIVSAKLFEDIKRRKNGWFGLKSTFYEDIEIFMDLPYKDKFNNNQIFDMQCLKKTRTKYNKARYSKPRQKPMYDNCQLVAPDGEVLCSCDKGKAQWYIYKGLGEVVNEQPFTVRLNFEPSGRPTLDNVFYTMEKINCCVVCGKTENYHRKLVVPSEYRRYFPNLMKKSLSHDVLLLCVDCHKRSNILDLDMRQKLAEQCDAPLINAKNQKFKSNPKLCKVKSAATALVVSGHKIPEARKKELEKIILDYYEAPKLTETLLNDAYTVDVSSFNESFIPHGLKVYQYFCKNGGLIQFERLWRQHFLDTMKPKFLPAMWSVEHNHKRLALQVINHTREVDFDPSILGITSGLLKEVEAESVNENKDLSLL